MKIINTTKTKTIEFDSSEIQMLEKITYFNESIPALLLTEDKFIDTEEVKIFMNKLRDALK